MVVVVVVVGGCTAENSMSRTDRPAGPWVMVWLRVGGVKTAGGRGEAGGRSGRSLESLSSLVVVVVIVVAALQVLALNVSAAVVGAGQLHPVLVHAPADAPLAST